MSALSLNLDTPALAQHYEQVSLDRQFKAGQLLVERLQIRAGERVLDVGSGTGILAESVAGIVGPQGSVLGIDPLPLRIEIAKRKTRPNLSFAVGDANQLEQLPDASFDVVYLNAVFHWLLEKSGPLRSFQRVLKPGGRLGISTGSKDHVNQIQQIRRSVLGRYPYRDYPESAQGAAQRVSQLELQALLEQAGFGSIRVELVPHVQFQPSAEAAVEFAQASSFGNFLNHLPDDLRQNARAEIIRQLDRSRTAEGIRQESQRLVAVAHKPQR